MADISVGGNAAQLAALLVQCRDAMAETGDGLLTRLEAQCGARAPLFEPAREAAALRALVASLLSGV